MKFKMSEKSLFAVLLRSPWWVSLLLAVVLGLIARAIMPAQYAVPAALAGFPFVVIAGMALWRQSKAPSASRVAHTLEAAQALSWKEFAALLEQGWQQAGFTVTRLSTPGADLRIEKSGRVVLVSGRRWKAATHGVEPLRELDAAVRAAEANAGHYVALGELSAKAAEFAAAQSIHVIGGAGLAQLLAGVSLPPRQKT